METRVKHEGLCDLKLNISVTCPGKSHVFLYCMFSQVTSKGVTFFKAIVLCFLKFFLHVIQLISTLFYVIGIIFKVSISHDISSRVSILKHIIPPKKEKQMTSLNNNNNKNKSNDKAKHR